MSINVKPVAIQCLNIDCPRCGSLASFQCRDHAYGMMTRSHYERIQAMETLISDSQNDWIVRNIIRKRNFSK